MGKLKPLTLATATDLETQPISLTSSTDPSVKITQLPALSSARRSQEPVTMLPRARSMSVVEQSRGINQAMHMLRITSLPAAVGVLNGIDELQSARTTLPPSSLPSFRSRSKSVSTPQAYAPTAYAAVLPQLLTQRSSLSMTMTLLSPIKEQH